MKIETAHSIVKQYEAIVQVQGQEYADRHFLAKGTERYEKNKKLLEEAREVIANK